MHRVEIWRELHVHAAWNQMLSHLYIGYPNEVLLLNLKQLELTTLDLHGADIGHVHAKIQIYDASLRYIFLHVQGRAW